MNAVLPLSCLVFLIYLLLLPTYPQAMFTDPDTYWHLAAGDFIRATGTVPKSDPWSLFAGEVPWYNYSWLWDVIASYVYEHSGWHGIIIMNSATIAAALSAVFAHCLIRSQNGISAFFTTMLLPCTLMTCNVRPTQFSQFGIALTMLLLDMVWQRRLSLRWLFVFPVCVIPWINLHGAFLVIFFVLGIYGLEALAHKEGRMFIALFATGCLALLACFITPYGIHMLTGLSQTMGNGAGNIIAEWRPLTLRGENLAPILYIALFLMLVSRRPAILTGGEKWITFTWLGIGIYSVRNLAIFGVLSAPVIAAGLGQTVLAPPAQHPPQPAWVQRLSLSLSSLLAKRAFGIGTSLLCLIVVALLWMPWSSHLYQTARFNPLSDFSEEINYIEKDQPHGRFFNAYNLGGPLLFLTHGKIPVFIDGREGTAYPSRVVKDYIAFHDEKPGWRKLFDRYQLDGAIIPNSENRYIDRFADRKGWHLAFKGKNASIFLRDKP